MENQDKPDLSRRDQLLEQALETSASPGVYLMKNASGSILYVGKAKHLKNRVTSYFQPRRHPLLRIELLVQKIDHFDVILTETESEALVLEWTLIKKHKPPYNIRLKDDKSYPYLKIQSFETDAFPRIEWTRKVHKDGARYFGPFPSAGSARSVMKLLNETFQLRDCSDNTFRHRSRPCILYQIGQCSGPCVGKITKEDYQDVISKVREVLEGRSTNLIESVKIKMQTASEEEAFEAAALYRDQLKNLELITSTQSVIEAGSFRNRDVLGIARDGAESHACVLEIRAGHLVAVKHLMIQNADPSLSESELLSNFLSQYYVPLYQSEIREDQAHEVGKDVLISIAPDDLEWIEKTLRLNLKLPETPTDQQLISVATTNANYALAQIKQRHAGHGISALEEVQEKLGLSKLPERIECYDISNIQGEDAVASRVVFIGGAPDKNLYRRYKIKTVEGSNDFAMMKEVLSRRFGNTDEPMPDLVVVDGGKGQLAQAVAIFEELNILGVEVVGLAKARTEKNFQAKEVKSTFERIFIPNRKNPILLYPSTESFQLLTHVRDEAHRFAVSYHRVVRSKRTLSTNR